MVKEKEPYQRLLEKLTQLIRQHTSSAGAEAILQQPSSHSPIHHAVEQVQEEVLERLLIEKEDKKYVVSIMPEFLSKVYILLENVTTFQLKSVPVIDV